LAGLLLTSPAAAAGMGQCPFTSLAGTGGHIENNAQSDDGANFDNRQWFDLRTGQNQGSAPLLAKTPGASMYYQESWSSAHDLGTVMIAAPGDRPYGCSGSIRVQRTPGGAFEVFDSFELSAGEVAFIDVGARDIWGVKIDVTDSDGGHYQVGSIGLYEERFTNAARGRAGDSPYGTPGNVTDQNIYALDSGTYFESVGGGEWIGVDLGREEQLRGLLIDTCAYPAYAWAEFCVQVYRAGQWDTLGYADPSTTGFGDLYWVDFGPDGEPAERVRLVDYQGLNAGLRITEIMALTLLPTPPTAPEPTPLTLLALTTFPLLRKKRN